MSEKTQDVFVTILSFANALHYMYQNMHWKSSGESYYGDHLLFQRLYEGVAEEIDQIVERAIGISGNDDFIKPASNLHKAASILEELMNDDMSSKDFSKVAMEAEKKFINFIDESIKIFEDEGVMTTGLEDLLPAFVSKHEEHMYLLQQRSEGKNVEGMSMITKLYKLAYSLDRKGLYSEADRIDEVIKDMVKRMGVQYGDLVSLADYFDSIGKTKIANKFDNMIKEAAKKKKTEEKDEKKSKDEKKAPKGWQDKMKEEIGKKNPDHSKKKISEIISDIWDNELSDKKKEKILKEHDEKKDKKEKSK